jgi:hypothetical protein
MTCDPIIMFLALHLIRLTGPDNQTVLINPDSVIALRDPRGKKEHQHFHSSVHCLVFTSDAKFTPVAERCDDVKLKLEQLMNWRERHENSN